MAPLPYQSGAARARRHGPLRGLGAAAAFAAALCAATAAEARSLIRDAGIEYALSRLAAPILEAAGMGEDAIDILLINDSSLNAFVANGRTILIHSGLVLKLDRPEELQAVIAHEIAHIANGHITRRAGNMESASAAAGLGIALGIATALAGNSKAGAGIATGAASSAQRRLFTHTRAEEAAADQSGAAYMARAGIDPKAMADVLDVFRGQEALSVGRQDPYTRTHPLSQDRIRALEGLAAAYKGRTGTPDPGAPYWYARVVTKLGAFLRSPGWTLRRVKDRDTGEIATLARAIAYHRLPDTDRALRAADQLLALRPGDPFYHELKGQILLESRRPREAAASYRRASELAPREALILAGLGRALLASDEPRAALDTLERARARDPRDPRMLRDMAVAYAQTGNNGMASTVTAERYAILGRFEDAKLHATRASGLLPRGSSGWLRAQDVLGAAENALRKGK
jgi:predicted Zn-dependent protease